jgi:hypothetical protein
VRGLIVFVVVVGAGLGWVVRQAHIQRDAVATIKNAGGSIQYEWEGRDGSRIPGGEPWAPRWLVDLIGVNYFGQVTTVQFLPSASATDATPADVRRLTRLQILEVLSPYVSDAGLAHLNGLTKLRHLRLNGTQVTDAGLMHLTEMTKLSDLRLRTTRVTDARLAHLKGLRTLSFLDLGRTQVTDAGLRHLKGRPCTRSPVGPVLHKSCRRRKKIEELLAEAPLLCGDHKRRRYR